MKARSLNGSEFLMMMEYSALRKIMSRILGVQLGEEGSKQVWDSCCKEYYNAMGCPNGLTYHSVHFPFGLSLDNAPIHKRFRKAMVAPRVTLIQEYQALFEAALLELGFDIEDRQHRERAIKAVTERLTAKRSAARRDDEKKRCQAERKRFNKVKQLMDGMTGLQFFIHAKFRKFHGNFQPLADEILANLLAPYTQANSNSDEDGPWEAIFRRKQAFIDPRWRCFLPEQFLPLGDTTPDLHQTAEMLVGLTKWVMKKWTLDQHPEEQKLLLAASYDKVMQLASDIRNEGNDTGDGKDQTSIRASLRRTYITAQIVATDHGVTFSPLLAPGERQEWGGHPTEFRQANFQLKGTGGRFPEAKWS